MGTGHERAVAETRRNLAEFAAMDARCAAGGIEANDLSSTNAPTPGGRRRRDRPGANAYSAVLSVRLDYELLEALERRAARAGVASSGLARTFIRQALLREDALTSELLDELDTLAARLRAIAR